MLNYLVTFPPKEKLAAVDRVRWVNWDHANTQVFAADHAHTEECGALRLARRVKDWDYETIAIFAPGTWLYCELLPEVAESDQTDTPDQPEALNDPR